MEAQLQIRRNAQEAQDQAEDLLRWTKQQQAKEAKLKHTGLKPTSSKAPPVRSGFSFKQSASTSDQKQTQQAHQSAASHAAGHTYDNYSKRWDSFDADADVSAPVDLAQTKPAPAAAQTVSSNADANQDLDAAMSRKHNQPREAETQLDDIGWKERGNELFKKGNFPEAKTAYSRSLTKKHTAVVYANRAQTCLKLGQAAQAEKDCSEALELDMQYIKAWQRRGTARKLLGNNFGAAEDFEQVIILSFTISRCLLS